MQLGFKSIKMNPEIKLYEFLKENLSPIEANEITLFYTALEDLQWQNLTDEEKWMARLGSATMTQKWSNSPLWGKGSEIIDHYLINLVEVSKIMISIINYLRKDDKVKITLSKENLMLLRIEGFILIEKNNIEQFFDPMKHIHKDFFTSMLNEYRANITDNFLIEQLTLLVNYHHKMYDAWLDINNEK